MLSSMPLPDGVGEAEYAGALYGKPLEVVKCETNDLYVSANSELMLKRTISVTETAPGGSFGEVGGYVFPGDAEPFPVSRSTRSRIATTPSCPSAVQVGRGMRRLVPNRASAAFCPLTSIAHIALRPRLRRSAPALTGRRSPGYGRLPFVREPSPDARSLNRHR